MRALFALVRAGLLAVLATGLAAVVVPATAAAHGSDATLVPMVTAVRPALPDEVLVQVRTGFSEQIVVANPTSVVLTFLDPDGLPFLQLSSAGVFGNFTAPYFHATVNPPDVPPRIPDTARPGAEPRWLQISEGDTWSWFDRRLHPFVPGQEPPGGRSGEGRLERAVVAQWQVGMRYGEQPVTLSGVLERRPITGTFEATLDPPPGALDVQVAQGQIPALLLQAPPGRQVTVLGRDGQPFLRIGPDGTAQANSASPHFQDNPQFQDRPVGPDGWVRVSDGGSVSWIDSRLRYSADRPPGEVEGGDEPVELARWTIPVLVDGEQRLLSGAVRWVPSAVLEAMLGRDDPQEDSGYPWATVGLAALASVLLLGVGALAVRTRMRAQP